MMFRELVAGTAFQIFLKLLRQFQGLKGSVKHILEEGWPAIRPVRRRPCEGGVAEMRNPARLRSPLACRAVARRASGERRMVEPTGIEPATFSLRTSNAVEVS